MQSDQRRELIRDSLRRLAVAHTQAMRQLEETIEILNREYELDDVYSSHATNDGAHTDPRIADFSRPVADRATLSVIWHGRSCFLGNTLLFRFFDALARRPGRYRTHSELLNEVWGGGRSEASVRHVAKRLRDKLIKAGMSDLAQAIDGKERGHFVLRLNVLR